MSDWQAGDLALCVGRVANIHLGAIYEVASVTPPIEWLEGVTSPALELKGVSHTRRYAPCPGIYFKGACSERFVKVTPPAADEWDRETIALMNGVRVGEPA